MGVTGYSITSSARISRPVEIVSASARVVSDFGAEHGLGAAVAGGVAGPSWVAATARARYLLVVRLWKPLARHAFFSAHLPLVRGGVSGGVSGGVNGGVSEAIAEAAAVIEVLLDDAGGGERAELAPSLRWPRDQLR